MPPSRPSSIMARTPMLRISIGLIGGIIISENLPVPKWVAAFILLLSLAAALLTLHTRRPVHTPALYTLFASLGILLHIGASPHDPFHGTQPAQLIATLRDTPSTTPKCYKASAEILAFRDTHGWHRTQGSILLYIQQDTHSATLRYGSTLWLQAQPHRPDSALNPYQFDYRKHLRHRGILYQCYLPAQSWKALTLDDVKTRRIDGKLASPHAHKLQNLITLKAHQLQLALLNRLRSSSLTLEHQGLVAAMVLGHRDDLQSSTQIRFRQSGITHLLCVSGLHVGIIASLVTSLFFFIGRKPWQRLLKGALQLFAVWTFALISGLAPATLRASLMFSFFIFSGMLGRQHSAPNSLCTSAVIILLANPNTLFDVGFQLSYAAMAGILLWHEPLNRVVEDVRFRGFDGSQVCEGSRLQGLKALELPRGAFRKIWGWTTLSFSAQLATLPLMLYYFHQFPAFFLIANLLIVPFMELILAACLLTIFVGDPIASVLQGILDMMDGITSWIAAQPHALIDSIYCDRPLVFLVVAALAFFTVLIRTRSSWPLPAMLFCVFIATVYTSVLDSRAERQRCVIVYHAGGHLAIECLDGRHSYLVCDTHTARSPGVVDYQRNGLLLKRRVSSTTILPIDTTFYDGRCAIRNHCLMFGQKRILIIDSSNAYRFRGPGLRDGVRVHFDAIVIAPRTWADTGHVKGVFDCDTLLYRYGGTAL